MPGNANSGRRRYRYPRAVGTSVCAAISGRADYERLRNAAYYYARQLGQRFRIRRDGEIVVIRREV